MANGSAEAQTLSQTLQKRHIVMIALGGVIGAGFFVGSSVAISAAGPAVLVAYTISGLLVFLVNLLMRDLALKVPGRYSFLGHIRHVLGEDFAFVAGWSYWLIWVIIVAIEAIAIQKIASPYIDVPAFVFELFLIAGATVINLGSVEKYGNFEYLLSSIKIAAIVLFCLACAHYLFFHPYMPARNLYADDSLVPKGWIAVASVIPTIVFSMGGSEIATIAAVEAGGGREAVTGSTRSVAMRIGGLYLTSIVLILLTVKWSTIRPGESPFLDVLSFLGIPYSRPLMSMLISVAALSALNSGTYVTSRVLHDLSTVNHAPRFFSTLSNRHALPVKAVLFSSAVSAAILSTRFLGNTDIFTILVSVTGVFTLCTYALITAANAKINRDGRWSSCVCFLIIIVVIMSMIFQKSMRHDVLIGFSGMSLIILFLSMKKLLRRYGKI